MSTASRPAAVRGLHHVTVIAGDAQENLDFYTGMLGLRLVKKSVNQDAPDTYHLFYADGAGTPGTSLTFFPWPGLPQQGPPRAGQIVEVPLAVPEGSLAYWQARFEEKEVPTEGVETRFGERALPFVDPHGLRLALVETKTEREFVPWARGLVPAEHQVRGMHAVRLWERELEGTKRLLTEVMGFEKVGAEDGWHRYAAQGGGSGALAEVKVVDQAPRKGRRVSGTGAVHHAAWRVRDTGEEQALRDVVAEADLRPTDLIDRFWFTSVYFREPGGVLFELATEGPGFTADEEREHLGASLVLPPWMQEDRAEIEAALPPLETSPPKGNGQ